MASAVDSRLAYARLSAVAMASRLPTANRGSTNSYTTSWDTTPGVPGLTLDLVRLEQEWTVSTARMATIRAGGRAEIRPAHR